MSPCQYRSRAEHTAPAECVETRPCLLQARPRTGSAAPQWPPGSDAARPTFSALLAASLRREAELRAWYDANLGYQHVRQTRLPKRLPKVPDHPGPNPQDVTGVATVH